MTANQLNDRSFVGFTPTDVAAREQAFHSSIPTSVMEAILSKRAPDDRTDQSGRFLSQAASGLWSIMDSFSGGKETSLQSFPIGSDEAGGAFAKQLLEGTKRDRFEPMDTSDEEEEEEEDHINSWESDWEKCFLALDNKLKLQGGRPQEDPSDRVLYSAIEECADMIWEAGRIRFMVRDRTLIIHGVANHFKQLGGVYFKASKLVTTKNPRSFSHVENQQLELLARMSDGLRLPHAFMQRIRPRMTKSQWAVVA